MFVLDTLSMFVKK